MHLPIHSINRLLQLPIGCITRRTALACLALGLSFLPVPSGARAANAPLKRFEYSLPRMGTMFHIELYSASSVQASKAAEAAFARAEELEQIMSDYRADSELMRLSREGATAPFPVSSDLYGVLTKSLWTSELSRGVFDVSIGPLVDLWRAARKTGRLPDPGEITKAKALVDYRNIELDPARHTAFLKRAGMKLDLGAIGKGYAADQMLAILQSQGIHHAMVVAGGEVVVGEPPPGNSGWKVDIDTADADAGHFDSVAHFEVLDVFEQGVQVVAALQEAEAAQIFQDDEGQNNSQGEKEAQFAFNIFFHGINEWWRVRFPRG